MKTNMKLKSTLWALAFAVAAVSCSDDLEENGGGTGITAEDGEGVYVTVNVGMASGPTTKAGETGNGDLEDSESESAVNDINIYLIPNASQTAKITTNDLSVVNASGETTIFCGYSTDLEPATGTIEHHDAKATVEISVPDLDKWYHVVAIVNAGEPLKFSKLAELRDYLQIKLWEGNNEYGKANDFVMSTHQMYQDDADGSDLFVSQANSDPSNPAETTVYVERLAARIDMQLADGLVSEDGSYLNGQTSGAKVKLAGYQVINQLVGGTYMLKRVSEDVTSVTGALTDPATSPYLADEKYGASGYNYVLDPWTANKTYTAAEGTTFPETIKNAYAYYTGTDAFTETIANGSDPLDLKGGLYENHFEESLNDDISFTAFMDENSQSIVSTTDGTFTPLLYTGENTMDVEQQKNGFTTGVIFKASYAPTQVSQYDETSGSVKVVNYGESETGAVKAGSSFFIANYAEEGATGTLAADLRTIAALGFEDGKADNTVVQYIFNEENSSLSPTEDNFRKAVEGMSGGALVIAFQEYLQGKLETITDNTFETVKADLTWNAFVTASGSGDIAKIPSDQDLTGTNAVTESENLMKKYNIAYYAGDGEFGVTNYLKYWIKHEPRKENEDMGVMEYAIVRNNVYQLQVSGIKNLGDPLPFTPGVDDPDNPNKETDIFILVNLYVRNWVKRSNTGIIL